jgi:hypothetical protein
MSPQLDQKREKLLLSHRIIIDSFDLVLMRAFFNVRLIIVM